MKNLFILWVLLGCSCTIMNVLGQSACQVPPKENMAVNSLPKEINLDVVMGSYPSNKIRKYINSNNLRKEIREAEASLEYCRSREEKFGIPNLPDTLRATQTCDITDRQIQIPDRVILKNSNCFVLKPWAGKRCSYVNCESEDCSVPKSNIIPVPDQFKCRPTNPRQVKVYAFCEVNSEDHRYHKKEYEIRSFTLRLPQCCSCIRFECLMKG